MSHFPGTDTTPIPTRLGHEGAGEAEGRQPEVADRLSAEELDETGNIELRCWACAAGALGEQVPDIVQMNPSWHHNYASLAWFNVQQREPQPHYPATKPELVPLINAVHALAHEAEARELFMPIRRLCRPPMAHR